MSNRNICKGDLVLLKEATYWEEWNGTVGIVLDTLRHRESMNLNTMKYEFDFSYRIQLGNGTIVTATPNQVVKMDGDSAVEKMEEGDVALV